MPNPTYTEDDPGLRVLASAQLGSLQQQLREKNTGVADKPGGTSQLAQLQDEIVLYKEEHARRAPV